MPVPDRQPASYTICPYQSADREGVRRIYGADEFARPRLLQRYPRMHAYLADEACSYYTDFEPESLLVAEAGGSVVAALLGAVDTRRFRQVYTRHIRRQLAWRCLSGAYGLPVWLFSILRTELATRNLVTPQVDLRQYPAHLHIGVLPDWRRQGIGTALMAGYAEILRQKSLPGYHLFASSFHPMGVAFYRKLGLEVLGQFRWRLHDGFNWLDVVELIFGKRLNAGR